MKCLVLMLDAFDHEYLYWVGCAGSFDDKNKKVTQAMAKLMQRAEIDFAILGPSENCTGDSARRSGNEYIFQMLAMQNIETLDSMGVRKIITQCPHCFNTLANEYPQLGGNYEVVHHSQVLTALVAAGEIKPLAPLDTTTLERHLAAEHAAIDAHRRAIAASGIAIGANSASLVRGAEAPPEIRQSTRSSGPAPCASSRMRAAAW